MNQPPGIAVSRVARLYEQSGAQRWNLKLDQFHAALNASIARAFTGCVPTDQDIDRYAASLHLQDLALATACAAGEETAWNHFIMAHRLALYRAAAAIDPTGAPRDLADSLYGELYGLSERDGVRQSLFRYFHGRSSLATWLRAVLAQRHVDCHRGRRFEPLPDDEKTPGKEMGEVARDPKRPLFVAAMRSALTAAIAALAPRDRLRLGGYYVQDLSLAELGKVLHEHDSTVSRRLARTRNAIRKDVERRLRDEHGLNGPAIVECFQTVSSDAGLLDLAEMIGAAPSRKIDERERSKR